LIILYEEENNSYKQEQSPFYHARHMAFLRSRIESSRIIFVSSAPSLELWWLAHKKEIKSVVFEAEAAFYVQTVDMSHDYARRSSLLSFPLQGSIQKTLEAKGKIVLLMNRMGFSTRTCCHQCGYTIKCKRCDVNLTYLYHQKKMVCRHCHYTMLPPSACPECHSSYLRFTGMGIEKLESEVSRLFPQARVGRFDKDSRSVPLDFDILIATQAILKIKEKLSVSLVAVLRIDAELNRLDFRSGEKTFSLLAYLNQLAGEKLIIQTAVPDNYCLKAARKMDFKRFYQEEIKTRRELNFPPFRHLIAIMMRGAKENVLFEEANRIYKELKESNKKRSVEILEPQSDIIPKLRGKYRFTLLVKGKDVKGMTAFIKETLKFLKKKSGMMISVNVDP